MAFKRRTKVKWWLYCPRPTSGGLALIRALKGKRIKADNTRFRQKRHRKVINWGSAEPNPFSILNGSMAVATCVNKKSFFLLFAEAPENIVRFLPDFTFSQEMAKDLLRRKTWEQAVARTVLNGHSGQGIVITGIPSKVPLAELYTRYIPKDEEYRIHCIRDKEGNIKVFYAQKKVKRSDFNGKHNRLIRSHANGYTYQHTGINPPQEVYEAATVVFGRTGLDFGAVDIIYCRQRNRAYVLEINTAPGLEGASVEAYAKAFTENF